VIEAAIALAKIKAVKHSKVGHLRGALDDS
jgi:hypothetical protein